MVDSSLITRVPDGVFCFCGKKSVVFDTWFCYFPCEDHSYMTPVEYSKEENND